MHPIGQDQVLAHGQTAEQLRLLEGPGQAEAGPGLRAGAGYVLARPG